MTSWRKALVPSALILAVFATLLILWRWQNQPRFQGKTAAQWFQEFRAANAQQRVQLIQVPPLNYGGMIPARGGAQRAVQVIQVSPGVMRVIQPPSPEGPEVTAAVDGLRGLGTNAVPYLAAQLRRRESWQERFYPYLYVRISPGIRKFLPNPPVPREEIRRQAAWAISALGSSGAPAAPALLDSLKYCGPASEYTILWALSRLDYSRERADEIVLFLTRHGPQTRAIRMASQLWLVSPVTAHCLLDILSQTNSNSVTNRGDRVLCVRHLAYFGKYAPIVVPGLAAALQDSDLEIRRTAAQVLEEFGSSAAPALPALEQALQSDDSELRYLATRAVEAMGTNAFPALPLLMRLTNDSFAPAQTVSKRIIDKLGSP